MRAYRLAGANASLQLVETPDPQPGPGEVLVDLKAATLNYRDIIVREERYGGAQRSDLIPLSDGAGVISAVGANVTDRRVGERVVIGFMPKWTEGPFTAAKQAGALGGGFIDGVLAERLAVPAAGVVPIPGGWSFEEAAAYPCAGVMAWRCLFGGRGVRPGDKLINWFGVACELHRDWRRDVEGLATLLANHIPDYRNLMTSYDALKGPGATPRGA